MDNLSSVVTNTNSNIVSQRPNYCNYGIHKQGKSFNLRDYYSQFDQHDDDLYNFNNTNNHNNHIQNIGNMNTINSPVPTLINDDFFAKPLSVNNDDDFYLYKEVNSIKPVKYEYDNDNDNENDNYSGLFYTKSIKSDKDNDKEFDNLSILSSIVQTINQNQNHNQRNNDINTYNTNGK